MGMFVIDWAFMGVKMDDVEILSFFVACSSDKNVWFSQCNRRFTEPDSTTISIIFKHTCWGMLTADSRGCVCEKGYHFLAL